MGVVPCVGHVRQVLPRHLHRVAQNIEDVCLDRVALLRSGLVFGVDLRGVEAVFAGLQAVGCVGVLRQLGEAGVGDVDGGGDVARA